jgi:hypothetical protein
MMFHQRGHDTELHENIIDSMDVRSRVACSIKCFTTSGCFGFDFTQGDGMGGLCVLHDAGAITLDVPQSTFHSDEITQNFGIFYLYGYLMVKVQKVHLKV